MLPRKQIMDEDYLSNNIFKNVTNNETVFSPKASPNRPLNEDILKDLVELNLSHKPVIVSKVR